MASAQASMAAEEFGRRPDPGHPEELVRGRMVAVPPPDRRHGRICMEAGYLLRHFPEGHDLGRIVSNDAAVITGLNPGSVRGADAAYYSYARFPRGVLEAGYGPEIPGLIIEVRSASDRWRDVHEKVTEYLKAGVALFIALDPGPQTAHVFGADDPPRTLASDEELTLPDLLDGFAVRVGRFFE